MDRLLVGRGIKGELALRRGHPERGVQAIAGCLVELHEARYELLTTAFNLSRAEGLAATGRTAEALALLDRTLATVHAHGDLYNVPELLRVKARTLLHGPAPRTDEAQDCLLESLDWSRRQGALAWELRAATDLARLWDAAGRAGQAHALLQAVFAKFEEGFETADLQSASGLLRRWAPATA